MKYLKISSDGIMPPEALTLVGASTKRGDSGKIGQFGSGNKFALAYLLRNNHVVKVLAGQEEIVIETKPTEFGGDTFHVVHVNEQPTSITTQMGKDWTLWQAIREIYSNAIDEGNHTIEMVNKILPIEGQTSFFISTNSELFDIVANFNRYFSDESDLLFENKLGKIYKATEGGATLYRRGIKCFETDKKSLYSYDLPDIEIDENRLVKYHWNVPERLWRLLFSCTDKTIIKTCLLSCADVRYIENFNIDFGSAYGTLSPEFIEVVEEMKIAPIGMSGLLSAEETAETTLLPNEIFKKVRGSVKEEAVQDKFKATKSGVFYRDDFTVSELHKAVLVEAERFLKECKFEIDYEIVIGRFDDSDVLGYANHKESKIILSEAGMDRGAHDVVNTIIEEYIHLKHNVRDETRAFQYASINELVNYMKMLNSYTL